MATVNEAPSTMSNSLVSLLECEGSEQLSRCNWLVVSHTDDLLCNRLRASMAIENVVVLQLPQATWEQSMEELADLFAIAVRDWQIDHVALVGHSQACVTEQNPFEGNNLAGSLLERLRAAQTLRNRARSAFSDCCGQILRTKPVAELLDSAQIDFHGYFYMAESGLFLKYDADRDCVV